MAGMAIGSEDKAAEGEAKPIDVKACYRKREGQWVAFMAWPRDLASDHPYQSRTHCCT